MPQIEIDQRFAFFAFWAASRAKRAHTKAKGQNIHCSALLFSHRVGAQVARQRCPILQPSGKSLSHPSPFAKADVRSLSKGTSLLCKSGDISTLP
jgi:hypothetical protein